MGDEVEITCCMTAYRDGTYIEEAIRSVLDQTFQNLELIVVLDPHPEDGCEELIKRFNDPRIRLIKNEKRIGLTASRNRGIELARGRFLAVLDSDDVSLPDRLEKQYEVITSSKDVGIVGSLNQTIDSEGKVLGMNTMALDEDDLYYHLFFHNAIPHSSILARTDAMREIGGYREGILAEDYDLFLRLGDRYRVILLHDHLVKWRSNEDSLSAVQAGKLKEDMFGVLGRNMDRRLSLEVEKRSLEIFVDHSHFDPDPAFSADTVKLLSRINRAILERAPIWLDREKIKRGSRKKLHSLIVGRSVHLGLFGAISFNIRLAGYFPGTLLYVLRTALSRKRDRSTGYQK